MTEQSAIKYDIDADGIVTLTLDDPTASANTMKDRYLAAMGRVVDELAAADIVGVIVTSAKKTFFAGGDLDLPHDKVNVNGGAIAMGHPLGATGAMILGTLVDELERRDLRYGLATLCVGGGMGIATIVERV